MKKFNRKRYTVQAKRRNTLERWTDWADTDNYKRAIHHACRVEELGYQANIVVRETSINDLLDILGEYAYDKVDAILDAGFCKRDEVVREIILQIDQMICCHANGDIDDKRLYKLFDRLKKTYLEGEDG